MLALSLTNCQLKSPKKIQWKVTQIAKHDDRTDGADALGRIPSALLRFSVGLFDKPFIRLYCSNLVGCGLAIGANVQAAANDEESKRRRKEASQGRSVRDDFVFSAELLYKLD